MRSRIFSLSIFLAPLLLVPFGGGCILLHAPDPQPTPTEVPPLPKIVYDVTEGTTVGTDIAAPYGGTKGNQLNSATDASLPFTFHATVVTPDTLILQPMYKEADGKLTPGTADANNPVRLAGIVVPTKNTVGYDEAMAAVQNWAVFHKDPITKKGVTQDLDVYVDPRYPVETEYTHSGKPLRIVQVFFQGDTGEGTKTAPTVGPISLNRWLVRAGWANVDMYSPTSFDQKSWLFDETFARYHKYGLWKYGVALQQRLPAPSGSAPGVSKVSVTSPSGSATPLPNGKPTGTAKTAKTPVPTPVPRGKAIIAPHNKNTESQTSLLPPPVKNGAAPAAASGDGTTSNSLAPGSMPGSMPGSTPGP